MLKKLTLALALAAATFTATAADETKVVTDAILSLVPQAKIDSVTKSSLPGFYEVVTGGQVVYVSADGKYLLQGSLFDMSTKKDLTEARLGGIRKELVDQVPKSKRLVFAPKDPKYTVTVFTDIDCGYCRKLHQDIAKYNEQGIAVEYLWFPRSGPGTPSFDKAVSVWCATDRNKAFTEAKAGTDPKSATCENPIAEEFELGRRVGINGTPTVIAPDGTQIGGYLAPEAMRQRLDSLASTKVSAK
ncbi:DsbC family protein [Tahibacter harae]|uniref:Thiol:disulfide interchange protein n=1 Tax=Tahibacter harae TaxID=2963937 RepID=A0ABT1QXE9_9GAMM|nr:DsbC family protein [Tahibacter harae]MCQ4166948.1 DsbC family protein [Tahibacter harae]